MNLKNSGDSTGFEPMTSAMPVQCSNQLSYELDESNIELDESSYDYQHSLNQAGLSDFQKFSNMQHCLS